MPKQNKLFLLHPFLAVLYFPLSLYSRNTSETGLATLAWTLGVCLAVTALACALMLVCLKRSGRTAVCLTIFIFLFFVYGYLFNAAQRGIIDPWITHFDPVQRPHYVHVASLTLHAALLLLYLTGGALLWRWSSKPSAGSPHINRAMSLAVVYLIFSTLFVMVADIRRSSYSDQTLDPNTARAAVIPATPAPGFKPDVYYIILDGYSRDDMLRMFYKYDNSGFINFLEKAGFYVPRHSYSNYPNTLPSLSSSLNMRYHSSPAPTTRKERDQKSGDKKFFDLIRSNEVMKRFKAHGYQVINLASTWSATMSMPLADTQFKYNGGLFKTEFDKALFGMSLLKVLDIWFREDLANWHRYNFEQLPKLAQLKSPKFVFAHFVLPHSPYVFDRFGNSLKTIRLENMWDKGVNNYSSASAYRDQLIFTTRMAGEAIAKILRTSKTPPIILVQADHGMNLVVDGPPRLASDVRHAIFTSYYFPDRDYSRLYDSISPVNSFRVVLSQYLGEDLELLPDEIH
jgi:hypothetical protein